MGPFSRPQRPPGRMGAACGVRLPGCFDLISVAPLPTHLPGCLGGRDCWRRLIRERAGCFVYRPRHFDRPDHFGPAMWDVWWRGRVCGSFRLVILSGVESAASAPRLSDDGTAAEISAPPALFWRPRALRTQPATSPPCSLLKLGRVWTSAG